MAEVLRSFDQPIHDESGAYHARVVGRLAEDGMWEAWFEFQPFDYGHAPLIGSAESRQPEREYLEYWAGGLSTVYVEGALRRARRTFIIHTVTEEPVSDAPASRVGAHASARTAWPETGLDPFETGRRSLDILAQELRALNRPRLLNMIAEYNLNPAHEKVSWMTDAQLARFIVVAVEAQLAQRAR